MQWQMAIVMALMAGQAAAQDVTAPDCAGAWSAVSGFAAELPIRGKPVVEEDGWCVIRDVVLDFSGEYVPDWRADELRLRGSALGWLTGAAPAPQTLEANLTGLRIVVSTGNAQTDYLFAVQAQAATIDADLALAWDPVAKVLGLTGLNIDFPGRNAVSLTARVANVDLSSEGAVQMSAAGFALTDANLSVTSHGLFESYMLLALGAAVLPYEGDMEAAVTDLKVDAARALADLPGATFAPATKEALIQLIAAMPNPRGRLDVAFRADPGFGPARFARYAVTEDPVSVADIATVLQGVVIDVGWQHEAAE